MKSLKEKFLFSLCLLSIVLMAAIALFALWAILWIGESLGFVM